MKNALKPKPVEGKIRELHGNLAAVGRAFGVTRQAVWDFVRRRPSLVAACQDCRESMKDHAESSLFTKVLAGEGWAVCFYLKTQAKDRGYVEKSETHLTGGVLLQIVEEVVDASPSQNGTPLPGASGLPPQ